MATLQRDTMSLVAEDLIPPLAEAVLAIDTDPSLAAFRSRPELKTLAAHLSKWDRQMTRTSSEAVMFFAFAHFASVAALSDELGPLLPKVFSKEPAYACKMLRLAVKKVPAYEALLNEKPNWVLVKGLADAADWLKERFGVFVPSETVTYQWGDIHLARFEHVLAGTFSPADVPVDGSVGTVNVSSSALSGPDGKPGRQNFAKAGSLFRLIIEFDSLLEPVAAVNFPRGNDENPNSPFFADREKDWVAGTHRPMLFNRAEIERTQAERFTIERD